MTAKKITTRQLFERFYGKPMEELTPSDLEDIGELNWGEDVGNEVFWENDATNKKEMQ